MSGLVALFAKEQLLVQKPRVTIPLRKASFSFAPSLGFLHQKKIYIFVDARKKGGGVWRRGGSGSESSESTKELVSRWIVEQIAALKDTTLSDKTQFYSRLTA